MTETKESQLLDPAVSLWPIYVTALLDQCAILVAIPVLPIAFLAMGYTSAEAAIYSGAAVSIYAASQLLGNPVSGRLSDKFSRHRILAGCGLISAIGLVLSSFAPEAIIVLVGRVVSGLGAGSRGVMAAVISNATTQSQRQIAFSRLNACTSAAYIIAPGIGGILSLMSWRLPFAVAGVLAFAGASVCWLSATRHPVHRKSLNSTSSTPKATQGGRRRASIVLISFFCSFANVAFPTTLAVTNSVRYGWSALEVGSLFTLLGVCGLAAQIWLLPALSRRLDAGRTLSLALVSGLTGITIYAVSPTDRWFYSGVPLMGLLMLAPSSILALLSSTAPPDAQGRTQAMLITSSAIASLIAPGLFSALLAWQLSNDPELRMLPAVPFVLSGLCLVLALIVHAITSKPTRR